MALAVNADVDALSAFTAHILAVHLRLENSFIDNMRAFFGNVFDFFSNMVSLFGGFFFVKCTLFCVT